MKTTIRKASTCRQAIRIGKTAIAKLNRHGWCQGRGLNEEGAMCATYAISNAERSHNNWSAEALFRSVVEDVLEDRKESRSIVHFNDRRAKSPRAVKNLFARAIKRLARKAR